MEFLESLTVILRANDLAFSSLAVSLRTARLNIEKLYMVLVSR